VPLSFCEGFDSLFPDFSEALSCSVSVDWFKEIAFPACFEGLAFPASLNLAFQAINRPTVCTDPTDKINMRCRAFVVEYPKALMRGLGFLVFFGISCNVYVE
jgi:hypothetical protein